MGGKRLGQGDRDQLNAERYDDWRSGKQAASGKWRQQALREGRAANGKQQNAGSSGRLAQWEAGSSGGCGRAELLWMANGEFRKRTPRGLGMTGWRQQGLREGRAAVDGIGLIQGDREATEHRNDWHGGKRAAFGKRRRN